MQMEASWRIVGVVVERRELTSTKNAAWRGYVCKIATVGLTAEVGLNAEQYAAVADGLEVDAAGRFEQRQDVVRLVATKIAATKAGRA